MVVGVIGLGQMGSGIAKNLIEKNFSVIVHDLRAEAVEQLTEKGARAYSSAKELASLCDVVITSLPMSPPSTSLENTITGPEGVLEGMAPGKIIIDCGSTSPFITRKINQECQKTAIQFFYESHLILSHLFYPML